MAEIQPLQVVTDDNVADQAATTVQAIGSRIRQLRMQRAMTLQTLADMTGLSASLLSLVERGKTSPSIGTLVAVSHALGVHMSDLVAQPGSGMRHPLVRYAEQARYSTPSGGERRVVADDRVRGLEIAVNDFMEGGASAETQTHHGGYEYGLLLSGELTVTLGDETIVLAPGDMVSYDSSIPHRIENTGNGRAQAVWVNLDRS